MKIFYGRWWAGWLLVSQLGVTGTSYAETDTLRLLGRSSVDNYSVELDENDWRWLRQHKGLVLGTSVPDYAPFDLSNNGHDFEGITADFSGLLSELLHVPISVRRYESRSAVIDALKKGEIDLLGTANSFEAADPALIASMPYAEDQPTLVIRSDDNPANRILLSQQLTYLGHHVTDAEDGAQGLRAWRNDNFDVVITDCNMPIMSGYQLAQAIRDEERARQLQTCLVLGFTANAQLEDRGRCLEAGMDDCLFKPISLSDLSQRLAAVEPRSREHGSTPVNLGSFDMDLSSLKQLARGDRATIQRLVNDLARSTEDDLKQLLRLYSSDDLPGLGDLAHRVKGGARIIKAQGLIQQCDQLEAVCSGVDADAVTEAVDALQQSMEALSESLETLREAGLV